MSTSLINRSNCKKFALHTAKQLRTKDFTRVGSSTFDFLEAKLRKVIEEEVASHPTIGKTLYLGGKKDG